MKARLFIAFGLLALLCLPAGLALADNGPHGNYTPTTDACAGCHRAHTADAAMLLLDDVPNLCYTCHGGSAAGADTDVVNGVYDGLESGAGEGTVGRGLKAGGFTQTLMDTDFDGTAALATTTSSHMADGTVGTVWGNGAIGSGAGASIPLSCVSCHDPHGGASTSGGATYRILRGIPTGSGASVGENITDESSKWYTVSDANNKYFGEGYPIAAGTWTAMEAPDADLTEWCAQCHTRYEQSSGSGSGTGSGDPLFTYLHMSNNAPAGNCTDYCHDWSAPPPTFLITTSGPEWHHYVECMTCHVAHGTSASMAGNAGSADFVPWPDGATSPDGDNRSSLLRADNRGVCQRCHGK